MMSGDGTISLPGGARMPSYGCGTWQMGEDARHHPREVAALRAALDAGVRMIDTAEMYAEGGAEKIVGEAIAGRREDVFLVSKVYPHNAGFDEMQRAAHASLERLGVDAVDLYLLHWPGQIPLEETVAAFEHLRAQGAIRGWGVSNFDPDDIEVLNEAVAVNRVSDPKGSCQVNQVLYHLGARGIEWDLVPAADVGGIPLMAYSPLGQGALLTAPAIEAIAERQDVSPAVVATAWTMRSGRIAAIPKTADPERAKENAKARDLTLDPDDLAQLDAAFPPPDCPEPLGVI
ncbi:MAG: aldo/keto reductase [Pseudomonadota bacterium]